MVAGADARPRPLDVGAPMALWLVDLRAEPPADMGVRLSPLERERADRFRHAVDRTRYLRAHAAVRWLVERHCGGRPGGHPLERCASGAWRVGGAGGWRLSFGYAGDAALVGLARGSAIGVDIEAERAVEDVDALAASHLHPDERGAFAALPACERDRAFLEAWTRKEACGKAIGTGLGTAPASMRTGLGGVGRAAVGGVALRLGSFATPGLVGAWARVEA